MIEDIATQVVDRGLQGMPGGAPVNGKELVGLLVHLAKKGVVVGYCGSFNPPQPKAMVVVIRDAGKNEVFKRVIGRISPFNEPAARKVEGQGERKVLQAAGPPIRWWYEKDDAVFSFAPPGADDPVVKVLDGKAPSALKNPTRMALAKAEPGEVPLGLLFVDLEALPPLPPKAAELGFDTIKRVEARWAILDKGLVTSLGIQAPRPRRGILALLDQPPIGAIARVVAPPGVTDFALLSVDPIKSGDAFLALLKQSDPDTAARLAKFAEQFRARTGLSLRDDLLGKVGPRMAVLSPQGGGLGNIFGMWFSPPEFGIVAEVKDARGFLGTLDRLIESANRELRAAGAMVPPQPGQPVRPGTAFAEFRRLRDPEQGYVLAVPPSVVPTPAGLRPTVLVDPSRGLIALGTSPASARRALGSLVLEGGGPKPARDPGAMAFAQSDPSGTLPALLANLPSLVQFVGLAASQPNGPAGPPRPGGRPPFRLQIDPDAIPEAGALMPYLFPSKFTMAADNTSIRMSLYQAFPLPVPQLNMGMEAPVLVALLLPAVQAAREAARRSQCVNNLKQIGLAMHNYHNAFGALPGAAIVDKQGKPLLSWRVAILPFIEQQALYNKFKLDEPWDSPHNKELIQYMPTVYACPSRGPDGEPGMTPYQAFSGPGALFGPGKPNRFAEVLDGLSNTLMVVEANRAVTWTKPDDLPFDEAPNFRPAPLFGAGSKHTGGFNALMGDGSVRFIKTSVSMQVLRALITKAGGEVVAADAF
jgi:prepilin-type processing-associated H-X9-DG protein